MITFRLLKLTIAGTCRAGVNNFRVMQPSNSGGGRLEGWGGCIVGTRTVCEAHSEACSPSGGSGGMPPQENFEKLDVFICNFECFDNKL